MQSDSAAVHSWSSRTRSLEVGPETSTQQQLDAMSLTLDLLPPKPHGSDGARS